MMKVPGDTLRASYAACRRIARQSRSNFCAGFLLLPRAQRQAMDALYAFMRHTDDLADNPQPANLRSSALVEWRAALDRALKSPPEATNNDSHAGRAILSALADSVHRFGIPPEHLHAVIDGVAMDLQPRRFETFEELRRYCELVASAVGLACIHVWGFRGPQAYEPARRAGIALQLTNILRDLRDDAGQGRVYLPLADLRACEYSVEDLTQGVADERFGHLVALEAERAEQFYRDGAALLDLLEPAGQRAFATMMGVYHALLVKIRRRPGDVLLRRVRLGAARKMQILWSAAIHRRF